MKDHDDLFITRADKENVTVILDRANTLMKITVKLTNKCRSC